MEEIFYRYNPWWEGELNFGHLFSRTGVLDEMKKQLHSKEIVFITGLRRIGKTSLMKLFIKHLIEEKGIAAKKIFYISLDEYQLSRQSIMQIITEYRKIHKITSKEKIYLFFDEITYKADYEQQLKNLYDSQQVKIYASSSSASLLKEGKPYLTGRSFVIEVLPLDFEEYLTFKKSIVSKSDPHIREKYFEEFLRSGGIPNYVLTNNIEYIKELADDIIMKDIAAFHKVRDIQLLKDYFLLLMERSGKVVSLNKLASILKIAPDSAARYYKMFEDTFLIHTVERFGKTTARVLAPKKIYAADLGIRNYFIGFRDKGSLFENYVYLKIKKFNPQYVYENTAEIDFITQQKTLIEVKYGGIFSTRQEALFNSFKAREKLVINSEKELEVFLNSYKALYV